VRHAWREAGGSIAWGWGRFATNYCVTQAQLLDDYDLDALRRGHAYWILMP